MESAWNGQALPIGKAATIPDLPGTSQTCFQVTEMSDFREKSTNVTSQHATPSSSLSSCHSPTQDTTFLLP